MHYMRTAKRYMDEGTMLDINNVRDPLQSLSLAALTS